MLNYNHWQDGGIICEVPKNVLDELNQCFDTFTKNQPDIHGKNYKQWFLQISKTNEEYDSTHLHWRDGVFLNDTKIFFNKFVSKIYRFRFSLLEQGSEVDFHTTHQLPRIHIPLNNCSATVVIRNNDSNETYIPLEYGKAYYTNVTKLHKVIGDDAQLRKNAFFSFTDFIDKNFKSIYCK